MKRVAIAALAVLLACPTSAPQARPLNSSERAEFARNFSAACTTGPHIRSMIESFGGHKRERLAYCDCAGNYFARKLTVEQAFDPKFEASSMHVQARDYCIKEVFGKSRKAK